MARLSLIKKHMRAFSCFSDIDFITTFNSLKHTPYEQAKLQVLALCALSFKRLHNISPYDEQFLGALSMADNKIIQMETGEGKTLTAVLSACIFALKGRVRIATVNEYLAKRDSEHMAPIYQALGLTVGFVHKGMDIEMRKNMYQKDVVYATHSEFGFDYLRDNCARSALEQVQTPPYAMIIDEIDSILLDEASTPLLLSSSSKELNPLLPAVNTFVTYLKKGVFPPAYDEETYLAYDQKYDYVVDTKGKIALLTSRGTQHAEQFFRLDDLTDDIEISHMIFQSLQAHGCFFKDKDYIVEEDKLFIIDQNTGRQMKGRRYSDGLWQAIEAKEHLPLIEESETIATISFRQYFGLYPILTGMTGTAYQSREEFLKNYALKVKCIPPHKKNRRTVLPDIFCVSQDEKVHALLSLVHTLKKNAQPCLIVTHSVQENEMLLSAFQKEGIFPAVLNAKAHEKEAEIIRNAGKHGAITLSTAMAGRGTDIVLDDGAKKAGGLFVIGFGHQNTKRGDRQLMGRCARQGDEGKSVFIFSNQDELIARFVSTLSKHNHKNLSRAQRAYEGQVKGQRKMLIELDEVISHFRNRVYKKRNEILQGILPPCFPLKNKDKKIASAIILSKIDSMWVDFLKVSSMYQQQCGADTLTGHNYLTQYAKKTSELFEQMNQSLEKDILYCLERIEGKTYHEHMGTL